MVHLDPSIVKLVGEVHRSKSKVTGRRKNIPFRLKVEGSEIGNISDGALQSEL